MRISLRLSDVTINEKMPIDLMRNKWAQIHQFQLVHRAALSVRGKYWELKYQECCPYFFWK